MLVSSAVVTQRRVSEESEVQENDQIVILYHYVAQFSKQQPITSRNPQDQRIPLSLDNRSTVVHSPGHDAQSRPSPQPTESIQEPQYCYQGSSAKNFSDAKNPLNPILHAIEQFQSQHEYPVSSEVHSARSTNSKPKVKQIPTSSKSGKRIQSVKSTEQLASDMQPVGSFKPTQSTSDIPKLNQPSDIFQQQTPEPLFQTAEPMLPNVSNANTSSSASASGHILPDKEDSDSPSLVPGTANRQLPIEENPTMDFLQEPTSQSNLVPTSAEPSQLTSGCKTCDVPVTSIQFKSSSIRT